MNSRAIMTLALRLMGFWVLIHALAATVNLVAILTSVAIPGSGPRGESLLLVESGFSLLAYAAIAAAMLLYAPAIASWFPEESSDTTPAATGRPATVRDVYLIAARLLGLHSLVSAVPALQRLARLILDYRYLSGANGEFLWAGLVEGLLYLAVGGTLIYFAAGIADVFSRGHGTAHRTTSE